jgi:hypothetical protein
MCVPLFLLLFLAARGLPVILYRHCLSRRDRFALAFYSATALPVVVAIVELGKESGYMSAAIASALVGAGLLSLIIYPPIALILRAPSIAKDPLAQHDQH